MRKTSKLFVAFLLLSLCTTGCSSLMPHIAPSSNEPVQQEQSEFEKKTREIYNLYLAQGGTLTYEEWLDSIRGQDGADGKDGATPYIGANGNWYVDGRDTGVKASGTNGKDGKDGKDGRDGIDGQDGADGKDGADGLTPFIGANGNWWIGETDTGIKAIAQTDEDNPTPYIGENNNWWFGNVDTGIKAIGQDGQDGQNGRDGIDGKDGADGKDGTNGVNGRDGVDSKDGVDGKDGADGQTPFIGNNGNWWIGNVDTGVPAQGNQGEQGVSVVSTVVNSEGELIVTFSDGTVMNAGKINFTEHVHEYESNIVPATCSTDGYVTFTCKTCGHIETVINKATGHIFEAWRESIPATCTNDGLKVRYCSVCGERQQETIPMHDHTISSTCIHNSATHWYYCTECGVALNETNHNYVDNTCSVCGYVLKENAGDSGMIFSLNSDGESYTLADLGSCQDTEIEVPDLYNGKPVVALGQGAFAKSTITSITMTNNIASIGAGCFRECTNLASIVLSNNITRIENNVFYGCSSLANISIPNGVISIGESAFESCGITSLVLPDSVEEIGYRSICSCNNLTRAVLSSNLKNVGTCAMAWNYSLAEVTIPEGCECLGSSMFERCQCIESIYLPASLRYISGYCFRYCSSLSSAIFGDPENWYVGDTMIAKEILQDEQVAARKIIALVESTWQHRIAN